MYPLDGHFPVDHSARVIRNYRYAAERMMRILGGWLALTPELSAKLLMGRHVWDNAQHTDAFGKRLPELRSPAQVSEPSGPAFVAFMNVLEEPEAPDQTVERLVGVYRVLKPHLLGTYQRHLDLANQVYEPPTRRVLARVIEDERRHVAAGEVVLRHLLRDGGREDRARAWHARLAGLLAAARGVTGDELSAPGGATVFAESTADGGDAAEFVRLEAPRERWPIPEELAVTVDAMAVALVAGGLDGAAPWLGSGAAWGPDAIDAIGGRLVSSSRVVACARLGAHWVVKLRLDAIAGSVTLALRWGMGVEGWRVRAIDVSPLDPVRPA
jgi:hypothetical protein